MALDEPKKHGKGVWKSGKGKGRHHTKGRQLTDQAWDEVKALLGTEPRRADLLIEPRHLWPPKCCTPSRFGRRNAHVDGRSLRGCHLLCPLRCG